METVQPIRSKTKINEIKRVLFDPRDKLLFIIGINSGLRISDILRMKVGDVIDTSGQPKSRYTLREKKTNKAKTFPLNISVQKAVKVFASRYAEIPHDAPLFHSRKKKDGAYLPITRQRAYEIINSAARKVGITEQIGTHSLRKTFGFFAYKAGTDLSLLMSILNHSSQGMTLRYIGITHDQITDVYNVVTL